LSLKRDLDQFAHFSLTPNLSSHKIAAPVVSRAAETTARWN
jgi:hypothetical protein